MREFTADELKQFDGREGRAAYVAYDGVVYDVTASAMWEGGDHSGWHAAGGDLTEEHEEAPHDILITGFPKVGTLV